MSYLSYVDVFAALADPVRRSLLARLAAGPARVVDLAASYDVSRPAVSKHLRVLSEAGLVAATERGRERHYALRPESLAPVRELLRALTPGPLTANALDALDTEVRRTVRERRANPARRPTQIATQIPTQEESA
ncbi:DNA-binding transcriptional regulator, ArsR family [Nocardioides lianchengensis]|uniref:DNA-binding transcriptional regulator, ArsR family n=1 Tax=Nocardioides lianchengensis TaxID=1045774 RepID=A0A1G6YUQ2_9ACTN|nr:DNA-binding transcriptional regulator, ArsR family [Nocardioides lianchengensis]